MSGRIDYERAGSNAAAAVGMIGGLRSQRRGALMRFLCIDVPDGEEQRQRRGDNALVHTAMEKRIRGWRRSSSAAAYRMTPAKFEEARKNILQSNSHVSETTLMAARAQAA